MLMGGKSTLTTEEATEACEAKPVFGFKKLLSQLGSQAEAIQKKFWNPQAL